MTNMELKVKTTKADRMQEYIHRPSLQCTALLMKGNLQLTATATAIIFGQYAYCECQICQVYKVNVNI